MSLISNISSSKQLEPCYILRPLGFYLTIIWGIGVYLNGSMLYIFIKYKQLRESSTNIFISGLILADFIGACFEIPLPAIALLNCRWIFTYIGCVFESIIAYFAGCSNMYILGLISIDRYFVVTRSLSSKIITIKQTYLIILCIYLLSLFWTLLPLIGWSSYDYEGTGASCSIKWEERSLNVISYNITIIMFVYFIPLIIIILTNTKIIKEIRNRRCQRMTNLNEEHISRQVLIENRITHTVLFIIGGFFVAWTPYAIIVCIRMFIDDDSFPPILATIPAIFAKTSVVWNPLIYVVRNENFRLYLPFCRHHHHRHHHEQRKKTSDATHFAAYPYCTVHLPLPSRSSFLEI